jgi:lysophospholipase L1-like esterase
MENNGRKPKSRASFFLGATTIIKICLVNLTIILFLAICLEIYLRSSSQYDYFKTNEKLIKGKEIHLNSSGYRDDEFNKVIKNDGSQKIIYLAGSSIAFGTGVAWNEVYAKKLQKMLNNVQPNEEYFVINAGAQGDTVGNVLNKMKDLKLEKFPELIIFSVPPSLFTKELKQKMMSTAEPGGRNFKSEDMLLSMHKWLYHNTRSYAFIDQEIRFRLFKMGILRERLDKINGVLMAYAFQIKTIDETVYNLILQAYKDVEEKLLDLKIKKPNATLILLGIPSRFMISDDAIDNLRGIDKKKMRIDPMEKIRMFAKKNDILFADLKPRLIKERMAMFSNKLQWDDLYTRNDYSHLNARGHELAAEVLFETIQANGLLSSN